MNLGDLKFWILLPLPLEVLESSNLTLWSASNQIQVLLQAPNQLSYRYPSHVLNVSYLLVFGSTNLTQASLILSVHQCLLPLCFDPPSAAANDNLKLKMHEISPPLSWSNMQILLRASYWIEKQNRTQALCLGEAWLSYLFNGIPSHSLPHSLLSASFCS